MGLKPHIRRPSRASVSGEPCTVAKSHWFDDLARDCAAGRASRRQALGRGARQTLQAVMPPRLRTERVGASARRHTRRSALKLAVGGALAAGPLRPLLMSSARADYNSCYQNCLTAKLKQEKEIVQYENTHIYTGQGITDPSQKTGIALGILLGASEAVAIAKEECAQKCGCPEPQQRCNGQCTDLRTDSNNCGSCAHVCVSPSTCQSGHCIQPGCVSPPVYCSPTQKCCTYTINGKTTGVCYDPSIQQCCSTGGACPQGGPCCSAGCCSPGQFCCSTIDPSNGRNLCGNVSTGFGC